MAEKIGGGERLVGLGGRWRVHLEFDSSSVLAKTAEIASASKHLDHELLRNSFNLNHHKLATPTRYVATNSRCPSGSHGQPLIGVTNNDTAAPETTELKNPQVRRSTEGHSHAPMALGG